MELAEAIPLRHSVRNFLDKDIPEEVLSALEKEITSCNHEGNLHIQLIRNEPKAYSGPLCYGKFHGVRYYLAMIGPEAVDLDERIGYFGERLVLKAQALGLNSCWTGLSYRKVESSYSLLEKERLACLIAVGFGKTQGHPHKNRCKDEVSNISANTPEWFQKGVESALLAPTAVNQQKFRFTYLPPERGTGAKVKAERTFSLIGYTRIDLGIARLHFELGAGTEHFTWL